MRYFLAFPALLEAENQTGAAARPSIHQSEDRGAIMPRRSARPTPMPYGRP